MEQDAEAGTAESQRCGARTRDGTPCEKYPVEGADRCRFHGGASTGPKDTSHLEGNNHAKGNSGGGAPELNTNAQQSGAWSDWRNVYERLDGEQLARVDEIAASALDCSAEQAPSLSEQHRRELALEYATLFVLSQRAEEDFVDRGVVVEASNSGDGEEEPVLNPSVRRSVDLSARTRVVANKLGLLPAGDSGGESADDP